MPQENTLLTPAQKLAQEAWHLIQQADQELLQLISELADPELAFDPLSMSILGPCQMAQKSKVLPA